MADLERELGRFLDPPIAEPAPVAELERRATRRRRRRRVTELVAGGTVVALVAALAISYTGDDEGTQVRPAAPSVSSGASDAFVQSTTVEEDGTRALLPPATLEDEAFADPDIEVVDGQSRDFALVVDEEDPMTVRLPTVALSWDASSDLALVDGARPLAADEVALNQVAMEEYDLSVGDQVLLRFGSDAYSDVLEQLPSATSSQDSTPSCSPGERCSSPGMALNAPAQQAEPAQRAGEASGDQGTSLGTTSYGFDAVGKDLTGANEDQGASTGGGPVPYSENSFRVVGVVEPPGGDVPGVGLSAFEPTVAAERLHAEPGYDRIGIIVAEGADVDVLRQRIGAELPAGLEVVPASALGSAAELRAELEIQQAYWLIADVDATPQERAEAVDLPPEVIAEVIDRYSELADLSAQNELRVQHVDFVDEEHARVAYDVLYASALWPAGPHQVGDAVFVKGRWKLGSVTICQLAFLALIPCPVEPGDLPTEEPTTTTPSEESTTTEPMPTEPSTTSTVPVPTEDAPVAGTEGFWVTGSGLDVLSALDPLVAEVPGAVGIVEEGGIPEWVAGPEAWLVGVLVEPGHDLATTAQAAREILPSEYSVYADIGDFCDAIDPEDRLCHNP